MAPSAEHRRTLEALKQLIGPLNRTLTDPSEIVLHDLRKLPDSIVAIAGKLSGREVGGPADPVLLKMVAEQRYETRVGYRSRIGDFEVRSSLVFIKDSQGVPFAAVCIHYDVSLWLSVRAISEAMLAAREGRFQASVGDDDSAPVRGIDELAERLLDQAIEAAGVPVGLMQKRHKIAIVRDLRTRGFFTLRDGIEIAGTALGVSRFTIYNYLNEIEADSDPE